MSSSLAPMAGSVVVVGPQFCAPHPFDLTVTKKGLAMTVGNFNVIDVNGNIVFKAKEKFVSLHGHRVLQDQAGNTILTMIEKILTIHCRWQAFRGDSTEPKDLLFSLKQTSIFQFSKTELDVFMAGNNSDDKVCDFKIKGNYFERNCTIYLGETDTIVAQISRKYTATNILLGKDTFRVTAYPHVDYAFITSLVIIIDDIHIEKLGKDKY